MPATSSEDLQIKLHKEGQVEYTYKQPAYEHLPRCPVRACFVAPSGSSKTTTLQDVVCRLYDGCWEMIYVVSPSIHLDSAWNPIKAYVRTKLKIEDESIWCRDWWDQEWLQDIYDTQTAIIKEMKKQKLKRLYGICVCLDDIADLKVCHGSHSDTSILPLLAMRGRHSGISWFCLVQKWTALAPAVRTQLQCLLLWRLRNKKELDLILDELSALYPKHVLMKFFEISTSESYSFMYVDLTAKQKENMFYKGFHTRLTVKDKEDGAVTEPSAPDR